MFLRPSSGRRHTGQSAAVVLGRGRRSFGQPLQAPAPYSGRLVRRLDAAGKLCRIDHGLADFKDMSADPRIVAALNLGPVVGVFLRLAIATVHSLMIDGHLARRPYNLLISPRR